MKVSLFVGKNGKELCLPGLRSEGFLPINSLWRSPIEGFLPDKHLKLNSEDTL